MSRTKRGSNQTVEIRGKILEVWLRRIQGRNQNGKIFKFSKSQFTRRIKAATTKLKIPNQNLTPHSLRYGGASFDFAKGAQERAIQHRGRWANFKHIINYVQPGETSKLMFQLPRQVCKRLERLVAEKEYLFKLPTRPSTKVVRR